MRVDAIEVLSGDVRLSGAVWAPNHGSGPSGVVLVGGSGPADRSNGGYFDALRDRFVDAGMTVLAYDKRGVGASSGMWASAGVAELAGDVVAAVAALRARPGVHVDVGRGLFHRLRAAAHSGCDCAGARRALTEVRDPVLSEVLDSAGFRLTDETWAQLCAWIDYAPEPDLKRLDVPALAIYGSQDPLVPVNASKRTLAELAPSLGCRIFDGADHRLYVDGSLATGYLEAVTAWYASNL